MHDKSYVLDALKSLIEDCTDPEWDFNNTDNWENMVLLLEQIETYIKGE